MYILEQTCKMTRVRVRVFPILLVYRPNTTINAVCVMTVKYSA